MARVLPPGGCRGLAVRRPARARRGAARGAGGARPQGRLGVTATPGRASGWYDDEADAAVLRYWDGTGWTPHTAARPAAAAGSARAPVSATAAATESVFATVRLPVDDPAHPTATTLTTVPTPPERPAPHPAEPVASAAASAAASARPVAPLSVLGAAAAAAALVLASAALAVALGR
ncbi:DUF2510 domain-containing protein [Agromyces tardus]|uniref:DUF2510 domain-containing protein n=1 Tax=Agromyces tardus TaxID=2583849 RepID=A0A3M7ZYV8_9MICO|nr:DUF2510 domain-containing protein [Agromyces tardus]